MLTNLDISARSGLTLIVFVVIVLIALAVIKYNDLKVNAELQSEKYNQIIRRDKKTIKQLKKQNEFLSNLYKELER